MVPRQGSVEVRAAYHAARNEILRPGATVFCSRYFCEKWIPRLGGTATALVLTLRAIAAENPSADDSPQALVEVSQQTLGRRVGCSANTIYRELKSNAELAHFVRTEERYVRSPKGRVRQSESVYYIAMDDPLLPEDEPLLEQIVERKAAEAAAPRPERVIVPERVPTPAPAAPATPSAVVHQNEGQESLLDSPIADVVHHNDGQQRADRSAILMDNLWSPKMMDYKVTESNLQKPVTVTPSGAGTGGDLHISSKGSDGLAAWRQTTEDLARHSAKELDDQASTGYHIAVWNHARKHDKQRGGKPLLTDGVFDILRDLSRRRAEAPKPHPQGKAWTRRTQKWFEENGVPLPVRSSVRFERGGGDDTEPEDAAAIRAALASAPFMRNRETE